MSSSFGALGLGIVGAVIGAPFGLSALGFAIGSSIGSAIFAPDGPTIEQPSLNDLRVISSAYGAPIPAIYGSMRVSGNIIWATDIRKRRHEEEVGGKGGPKATQVTYTYDVDVAIGICAGEITGIRKIWADGKVIYNTTNPSGVNRTITQNSKWKNIRVYTGSETQLPDPLIESHLGAGNVPGHRGLAYIVINTFELLDFGGRIPNLEFEIIDGAFSQVITNDNEFTGPAITNNEFGHNGHIKDDGSWTYYQVQLQPTVGTETGTGRTTSTFTVKQFRTVNGQLASIREETELVYDDLTDYQFKDTQGATTNAGSSGQTISNVPCLPFIEPGVGKYNSYLYDIESGVGTFLPGPVYLAFGFARYNNFLYVPAENTQGTNNVDRIMMVDLTNPQAAVEIYDFTTQHAAGKRINGIGADADGWYFLEADSTSALSGTLRYFPHGSGTETGSFTISASIQKDSALYRPDPNRERFYATQGNVVQILEAGKSPVNLNIGASVVNVPFTPAYGFGVFASRDSAGTARDINFDILHDSNTPTTQPLSAVVTALCQEGGLAGADLDVTDLTGIDVVGYMRGKPMPIRGAIEPLQQTYQFDIVESEAKIKFILRGNSSIRTISEDDLSANEDNTNQSGVSLSRAQDTEIPRKITVTYANLNKNYEQDQEYAARLITQSTNQANVTLPIVLTASEARQTANVLLLTSWQSRVTVEFSTWIRNIDLEPTDVITLDMNDGDQYEVLITAVIYAGNLVKIEGVLHDADVYSSIVSSDDSDEGDALDTGPGPTELVLLDIPPLSYIQNDAGLYAAVQGYLDEWDGAIIFRSPNNGESFNILSTIYSECVMGRITSPPGDVSDPFVVDYANTLTVEPYGTGVLETITEAEAINGGNFVAIGSHGRWEIISFANATDNGDGTFTLDTLIRGRRGTDHNTGGHLAEDLFVVLTGGGIANVPMEPGLIGSALWYQVLSVGFFLYQAQRQQFTNNAVRLLPFSPVDVEGSRDGSNNLTITWTRRDRLAGEWIDGSDIPMSEQTEAYEVDILDGMGAVLRTISATSETASYTAAEQTTDGLTPGDPVDCIVYQLSAVVGRGTGRSATV